MALPVVKLQRGIHVMHLFSGLTRSLGATGPGSIGQTLVKLEALCAGQRRGIRPADDLRQHRRQSEPGLHVTAAELGQAGQLHRDLETVFRQARPNGFTLISV